MSAPRVPPLLGRAGPARSSTSGCRRRARATSPRTSSTRGRPSTRSTCGSAERACSSSSRPTSRPRTSSATTPTSRPTPTPGCGTPSDFVDLAVERLGLGAGLLRRRGGQQRRLPAAAQRRARHPVARHRAGGQRRRGGRGAAACPPRWCSSARRPGARSPTCTAGPTSSSPTTSSPTCPTSSTSARGLRALVADDGHVTHRDPAPAAADRGQRVRHDLPRALLLPLAADDPAGAGRGRPDGRRRARSCRTHGGSLRTWSVPTEDAGAPERRRRAGAGRRGGRRAATPSRATRASPTRWPRCATTSSSSSIAVPARGQAGGRLRRARQGQHPAQPLRHPQRPDRVRGGPQPVQARPVPARAPTSRSSPVERLAEDRPDYVVIMPWNLRAEITAPAGVRARVGARARRRPPQLEVF